MCIGNTIDDFLYALLPLSLSLVRDLKKGVPNPLRQKLRELHTFSALYFKPLASFTSLIGSKTASFRYQETSLT